MDKDKKNSVYFNRESFQFEGLTDAVLMQLKEAYSAIDVKAELAKMCLWLQSQKGKARKGNIGFILNWLNNAAPSKAPSVVNQISWYDDDSALSPFLREYLQDLWKNREHIFHFNTIR